MTVKEVRDGVSPLTVREPLPISRSQLQDIVKGVYMTQEDVDALLEVIEPEEEDTVQVTRKTIRDMRLDRVLREAFSDEQRTVAYLEALLDAMEELIEKGEDSDGA